MSIGEIGFWFGNSSLTPVIMRPGRGDRQAPAEPLSGKWFSALSASAVTYFGQSGDVPVAGD